MSSAADEFSGMILKRSPRADATKLSLDISLANLLWALDGVRPLGAIARQDGYDLQNLIQRVEQLMQMGLVEKVDGGRSAGDLDLAHELTRQLSFAVGPIADILIEDIADELGCDLNDFPIHRLDELIQLLRKEIRQKDKAEKFANNIKSFVNDKFRGPR